MAQLGMTLAELAAAIKACWLVGTFDFAVVVRKMEALK